MKKRFVWKDTMTSGDSLQFLEYLRQSNHLAAVDVDAVVGNRGAATKLWDLTNLSPNDFADQAAQFFGLRRIPLPEMLAAASLVELFSSRFLREMYVFPYRSAEGMPRIVVTDPGDSATQRAAEIVLGAG